MDPEANLRSRLEELEKLDERRQRAKWEQEVAQARMKAYHDRKIKQSQRLSEGDLVLWYPGKLDVKRKSLRIGWSGPYKVFRIYENGSVILEDL